MQSELTISCKVTQSRVNVTHDYRQACDTISQYHKHVIETEAHYNCYFIKCNMVMLTLVAMVTYGNWLVYGNQALAWLSCFLLV